MSTKNYGYAAITKIAKNHRKSPELVRREMENAIDAAWASEDPIVKAMQKKLFPKGNPTVEEFISTMAAYIKTH